MTRKAKFHARRIERLVDGAACRRILRTGKTRLVTVPEIVAELTEKETAQIVRSAYTLAGATR